MCFFSVLLRDGCVFSLCRIFARSSIVCGGESYGKSQMHTPRPGVMCPLRQVQEVQEHVHGPEATEVIGASIEVSMHPSTERQRKGGREREREVGGGGRDGEECEYEWYQVD